MFLRLFASMLNHRELSPKV